VELMPSVLLRREIYGQTSRSAYRKVGFVQRPMPKSFVGLDRTLFVPMPHVSRMECIVGIPSEIMPKATLA